ncbi:MAG: hypothetical protein FJ098_09185 [Deltaproteobacteria bacterium]|nr:hypothetical protein [Deltaproteobacteria bacterium]
MKVLFPLLALLALVPAARGQELVFLAAKGGASGELLLLETGLDMVRGFDRRTLVRVSYPENRELSRRLLLEDRRAVRLRDAGDWELFRALEDRALEKALARARTQGFRPVPVRPGQREACAASLAFPWGPAALEVRVAPGPKRAEVLFRRLPDGPERRTATLEPVPVDGSEGPERLVATTIFEAALLGDGRVLALVAGAWDPQGGRRVGWERLVLLPLGKTARLWDLPLPLAPAAPDWRSP